MLWDIVLSLVIGVSAGIILGFMLRRYREVVGAQYKREYQQLEAKRQAESLERSRAYLDWLEELGRIGRLTPEQEQRLEQLRGDVVLH